VHEGAQGRERGDISNQSSRYLSVKLDGECNKAHNEVIQHRSKSAVATSEELHHDYRT
jgi:hypothetical protein